jgi:hypothetical protein
MEERRKVWQVVSQDYDFERPVSSVIEHLTDLVAAYPGQALRVEKDYYGSDGGCYFNIEVERLETDAEFNARVNKADNRARQELNVLADLISRHPTHAMVCVDKIRESKEIMVQLDKAINDAVANINKRNN